MTIYSTARRTLSAAAKFGVIFCGVVAAGSSVAHSVCTGNPPCINQGGISPNPASPGTTGVQVTGDFTSGGVCVLTLSGPEFRTLTCDPQFSNLATFDVPQNITPGSYIVTISEPATGGISNGEPFTISGGGGGGNGSATIVPATAADGRTNPTTSPQYEGIWATPRQVNFTVTNTGNTIVNWVTSGGGTGSLGVGMSGTASAAIGSGATSVWVNVYTQADQFNPIARYPPLNGPVSTAQYYVGTPTVGGSWPTLAASVQSSLVPVDMSLTPSFSQVVPGNYGLRYGYTQTAATDCSAITTSWNGTSFTPSPPAQMASDFYLSACWIDSSNVATLIPQSIHFKAPSLTISLGFRDLATGAVVPTNGGTCSTVVSGQTASFTNCYPQSGTVDFPIGAVVSVSNGSNPNISFPAVVSNPSPNNQGGVLINTAYATAPRLLTGGAHTASVSAVSGNAVNQTITISYNGTNWGVTGSISGNLCTIFGPSGSASCGSPQQFNLTVNGVNPAIGSTFTFDTVAYGGSATSRTWEITSVDNNSIQTPPSYVFGDGKLNGLLSIQIQNNGTVGFDWKFSWNFDQLTPTVQAETISGPSMDIAWAQPLYVNSHNGIGFTLQGYSLIDMNQGSNVVVDNNIPSTALTKTYNPYLSFLTKNGNGELNYRIRARYKDLLNQTFYFDSATRKVVPPTATFPTLNFDFYSLRSNSKISGCSKTGAAPMQCTPSNPSPSQEPLYVRMYSNPAIATLSAVSVGGFLGNTRNPFNSNEQNYLLIVDGTIGGTNETLAATSTDGSASTTLSMPMQIFQTALFAGTPTGTMSGTTLPLSWSPQTFGSGSLLVFDGYDLTDAGGTVLGGSGNTGITGTSKIIDITKLSGYSAGQPLTFQVRVRARYHDVGFTQANKPYAFSSAAQTFTYSPTPPPTITYTFFSLLSGASLGSCDNKNNFCGGGQSFAAPVRISVSATPFPGDTLTGLAPANAIQPPVYSLGSNTLFEVVQSQTSSATGSLTMQASTSQTGSTSLPVNITSDLSMLVPGAISVPPVINPAVSTSVQIGWGATNPGGAGLQFTGYSVLDSKNSRTMVSNLFSPTHTFDLTTYQGFSTWWGDINQTGPFDVKLVVQSAYTDAQGRSFQWNSAERTITLNKNPPPTIRYDAFRLADGTTPIGTPCVSQGGNACAGLQNFSEPILVKATATPAPSDTITNFSPVATLASPPFYPGVAARTWEILESNKTQSTMGTLEMRADTAKNAGIQFPVNYQIDQSSLFPTAPRHTLGSGTIDFFWTPPTYVGGTLFRLQQYRFLDAKNGNTVLGTVSVGPAPTYQLSLSGYPGYNAWFAAGTGTFDVTVNVQATYTDGTRNFTFELPQAYTVTLTPSPPITITYTAYKLSDGVTQIGQICASANLPPCGGLVTLGEPALIKATATPPQSVGGFGPTNNTGPTPPLFKLPGKTDWEMSDDGDLGLGKIDASGTIETQATSLAGVSGSPMAQGYKVDLGNLFATGLVATSINQAQNQIIFNWIAPAYGSGGPGYSFVAYDVLDSKNGSGSLRNITNINTLTYTVDLNTYPGYTAWKTAGTGTFDVKIKLQTTYKTTSRSFKYLTDQQVVTLNPGPKPVLSWQIKSMANGTVLSNCVNPAPTTPLVPPCLTGFQEPVTVRMAATITNDTISSALATILDPASVPVPVNQSGNVFNWRLASSQSSQGPLTYTANASASGVSGGNNTDAQTYTLNLGDLFATPYLAVARPASISILDFSWSAPLFVDGAGFGFRKLEILWDSARNSAVANSPQLFTWSGSMASMPLAQSIDFATNQYTAQAFKNAGNQFATDTLLRVTYQDTATGAFYTYDTPLHAVTSLNQPPVVTFTLRGVVTQNTLCVTHSPPAQGDCVPGTYTEPAFINLSAIDPENNLLLPYTPSASYVGMVTPPAATQITASNWDIDLRLPVTYQVDGTAKDGNGLTTPASQSYTLNLSRYAPTTYTGTAQTSSNILFTWTDPAFTGNSTFIFQDLSLMWDDSVAKLFGGTDQLLQSGISLGNGLTGVTIDFANNPAIAAKFAAHVPLSGPFATRTYLLATFLDSNTGDIYQFKSSSINRSTLADAPPTITFSATGVVTGASCVYKYPTIPTNCTTTFFNEPLILNITATDSDGTIQTFNPPAVTYNPGNGTVNGQLIGSFSYDYDLSVPTVLYSALASATDNVGVTQNAPVKNYSLNLNQFTPTTFKGTGTSYTTVNFTWVDPAFGTHPTFQFQDLTIMWDDSIAKAYGGVDQVLLNGIPLGVGVGGVPIDLQQNPGTSVPFAAHTPLAGPFTGRYYIVANYLDINTGKTYSLRTSPSVQASTLSDAPPTITYTIQGVVTGNTCAYQFPIKAGNCNTNLFTEPVVLNVAATDSDGTIQIFNAPSVTYTPGAGVVVEKPAGSFAYDYVLQVHSAVYTVVASATDNMNVVQNAPPKTYNLNLGAYIPTLAGSALTSTDIKFTWTDPTFGLGNANLTFQNMTLMWDDSIDNYFNKVDQPLVTNITLGKGVAGTTINFAQNVLATAFANHVPLSGPFMTHTYMLANYKDINGNTFSFRSAVQNVQTLPDQPPVLLFQVKGIATNTIWDFHVPGQPGDATTTNFSEPVNVNISASDVDGTVNPLIPPTATYTPSGSQPVSILPGQNNSWDIPLTISNVFYSITAEATDNVGVKQGPATKNFAITVTQFLPTNYAGVGQNAAQILFTWVDPVFGAGNANLTFVSMSLWWDDSTANAFGGVDQVLVTGIPLGSQSSLVDFTKGVTAVAYQNHTPLNSPFQTQTYLESTYRDTKGNLYKFRLRPSVSAQTAANAAPTITYTFKGIATGNICTTQFPITTTVCPTTFDEPIMLNLAATDSDGSIQSFAHSVTYDPGTGVVPVPAIPAGPNSFDHMLDLDALLYTVDVSALDNISLPTVNKTTYILDLSSFVPKNYVGTPLSLTTIRFDWQAPTFIPTPGLQFVDMRLRWRGLVNNVQDPILLSGMALGATNATINFALDPFIGPLFAARSPRGATFTTNTYIEVLYVDSNRKQHTFSIPTLTLDTTQNITLAQPGTAVSVGTTTITGQWIATSSDLLDMISVRARATDGTGSPIGSLPIIDLTATPVKPVNTLTLTVDLLIPNTSYTMSLEGSYDGTLWYRFGNSSFTATTNASIPPSPVANLLSCNVNIVPVGITLATDINFLDSQYAILISSNGLPGLYLNTSGTLQASPVWQTMAAWTGQVVLNDAGLANTLSITTLVLNKNTLTPIPSAPTIMTTPGGPIGTSFPSLTSVSYDNLLYGVPLNQGFQTSFTTNMDPNTFTTNVVKLKNVTTGAAVPISMNYADTNAGHILTVTPQVRLSPVTIYQLDISAGLADKCGFVTQQSFSLQLMSTIDPAQTAAIFNPLDPSRTTSVNVPANTVAGGTFIIPRVQGFLIKPNATVTAAPASIDSVVRANRGFRELKRVEILIFNTGSNNVPVMGNASAPVNLIMSANGTAVGAKGIAGAPINQVDAATLNIFYVDTTSNQYRLIPVQGAKNNGGVITAPITKSGTYILAGAVTTSLSDAKAYPVPFKPSVGHSQITFANLGGGATIKVFTIAGELVKEITTPLDTIQWDVKNSDGENVASGVYLYQIKNAYSEKRGKLMIIR